MATVYYYGDAVGVEDEWRLTPANVSTGNIGTVTINGKDIVVTAAEAGVAAYCALLAEAINANEDNIPEFAEVEAVDNTTYVAVTGRDPGVPIGLSSSATGGTMTLVASNPTPATGPWHFDNADNYSGNVAPVDGDTVVHVRGDMLYGLSQTSLALAAFYKVKGSGSIGLPEQNIRGYDEYRQTSLALESCPIVQLDDDAFRVKIDTGTALASTATIRQSGRREDPDVPVVLLLGSHASNVANILKGDVGIAFSIGETAQWPTVTVGYMQDQQGDVALVLGSGCSTITSYKQSGGRVLSSAPITTLTMFGGEFTRIAGAVATAIINGGSLIDRSEAAISTRLIVSSGGVADFGRDLRAATVQHVHLFSGSTLLDPNSRLTFTAGIDLQRCKIADVTLDLGDHRNLVITAAA